METLKKSRVIQTAAKRTLSWNAPASIASMRLPRIPSGYQSPQSLTRTRQPSAMSFLVQKSAAISRSDVTRLEVLSQVDSKYIMCVVRRDTGTTLLISL